MSVKRFIRIAAVSVGAVFLLLCLGLLIVAVLFPSGKIKEMTLPYVEKAVGRQVSVASVNLSFYPQFGVKIKGLTIANTKREGFSDQPFVALDRFMLKVKVKPLFKRRLEISAILLEKPHILVEINKAGSFNFDDCAFMVRDTSRKRAEPQQKSGLPSLPIPLSLEKFAISGGEIAYVDAKSGAQLLIKRLDEVIHCSIDKELKNITTTGELVLGNMSLNSGKMAKPLTDFTVTFSHDIAANLVDGSVTINTVRVSLQKLFIELTGKVTNMLTQPNVQLSLKTEKTSLADIMNEIPKGLVPGLEKIKTEGFFQLGVEAIGTVDSTGIDSIRGVLVLENGKVQFTELPEAVKNIETIISFTKNSVDISKCSFLIGANPVQVQARVNDFKAPKIKASVSAKVLLDDVKNAVKLPPGVALGGQIEADIKAQGTVDPINPANPNTMQVQGALVLSRVQATLPQLLKPLTLDGTVDLSPKRITNFLQVKVGSSDINLKADCADYFSLILPDSTRRKSKPQFNFTATSAMLNMNEILKKEPKSPTVKDTQTDKNAATPILAAPIPGIDVKGTIECQKFINDKMEMSGVKITIASLSDVIKIMLQAKMLGGDISNTLTVDAKNIRNVAVTNAATVTNMDVSAMLTQANSFVPPNQKLHGLIRDIAASLQGIAGSSLNLQCHGLTADDCIKSLDGSMEARLADGTIKSSAMSKEIGKTTERFLKLGDVSFRTMQYTAFIQKERVILDKCEISSVSAGDWNITGSVGFDGTLDFTLADRLPRDASVKLTRMENKEKQLLTAGISKIGGKIGQSVAGVASEVTLIPSDQEGRVTVLLGLTGTGTAPSVRFQGFKSGQASDGSTQSGTDALKADLQKNLDLKKKEAEELAKKKLEEEKAALQKLSQQQTPQIKQEATKAGENLKNEVGKKLKKIF
ncbi:MAG: AsmA family protein [Chitinivibrionales bacterium]|nr:AsmA family protein [Chitinivibrionales bacterium]